MFITCKHSKRIICILKKVIWFAIQWIKALLNKLNIVDWNIFKIIIFDRDKKFLFDFWKKIFRLLNVFLLYFIVYYSQIDEQFKRINQIMKIVLRFVIVLLIDFVDYSNILLKLQRALNNNVFNNDHTFNEIVYNFTFVQLNFVSHHDIIDVLFSNIRVARKFIRLKMTDVIALKQMYAKFIYDKKHKSIFIKTNNWALFRLHKNYDISSTTTIKKKLFQQYVDFFQIIEKIDHFVYRLAISKSWRVHFVFIIAQLKFVSSSFTNFFNRSRFIKFNAVFVKSDINRVKFYEIKRFFDKRQTARRDFEYFVKWKNYDFENDAWKNISKLNNVMKLIQKYEINYFIIVVKRTIKFLKSISTQVFLQ